MHHPYLPRTGDTPSARACAGKARAPATDRWQTAFLLSAAALLGAGDRAWAQPPAEVRVARYSTVSTTPPPAQSNPLEAVVQLRFPRAHVRTVGDAVSYLLLRSGYRLAPTSQIDEQVRSVLDMALPEVHRSLGPCSVSQALAVLLGAPFVMSSDPVRREVTYRMPQAAHDKTRHAGANDAPSLPAAPPGLAGAAE